ncbi:type IV toxin-antitoxin system AbiEi family antitoxin [Agromyces sp. GXS1127]|uniref:type IV toxin-antitoxin system AbiEi family antitoxin n=1 Tax=Agromyces sp. GXS1127 TaxID=3424181 RepID=UPI003D310C6A
MARLPSVLDTADLPLAELCAARLDGELMRLGDGWCPVDEPDLPSLRAAVVAPGLPAPFVIERRSAAWVHGALPTPPTAPECCVPHVARVSTRSLPRAMVLREVAITADEITVFGGIRCTTLDRTVYDLVREPKPAPDAVPLVAALIGLDAGALGRVRARIQEARRMPHKAAALRHLDAATEVGQPSLTRYTS